MTYEADVIIVGAGLSGLIAARDVLRAGREPLILEGNDRVGGRILTEEVIPGMPLELGAQWIGDTHHRMFALAAELGVETRQDFSCRVAGKLGNHCAGTPHGVVCPSQPGSAGLTGGLHCKGSPRACQLSPQP